jgi:hypothetical protein
MINLITLHGKNYHKMSSKETFIDREHEFNELIQNYELQPESIADYLLIIRENQPGRSELIHNLIDNYEYAEAILIICKIKLKR